MVLCGLGYPPGLAWGTWSQALQAQWARVWEVTSCPCSSPLPFRGDTGHHLAGRRALPGG